MTELAAPVLDSEFSSQEREGGDTLAKSFSAWQKLTWDDLDEWAGSRSVARGKSYQGQGRVRELGVCGDGCVIATVTGSKRYLTQVTLNTKERRRADRLACICSCPVAIDCKHGVATVIELLEQLEEGQSIPEVDRNDFRLKLLADESKDLEESIGSRTTVGPEGTWKRVSDEELRSFLKAKTKADLVERLMAFCAEHHEVRSALTDEIALKTGRFDDLLEAAYGEMRSVTAKEAWYNAWRGEGTLPDYSNLQKRMRTLLELGCADEVVELGQELVWRGMEQIKRSDDDGYTCGEIAGCLTVVAEALEASSATEKEKLATAIRLVRSDSFGICETFDNLLSREWPVDVWSTVADELSVELNEMSVADDSDSSHVTRYQRRQLSEWLIQALGSAGRFEESLEVCLSEAKLSGEYVRAVDRLLAEKRFDTAESVALEGLANVEPRYRGIVNQLQDRIAEIAIQRKDWSIPASIAAMRFFGSPSVERYRDLLKAAKKAKCEEQVAKAASEFLETGERPDLKRDGSRKLKASKTWPLPPAPEPARKSEYPRGRRQSGPHYSVLIDLAIADKRSEDVLKWYDLRRSAQGSSKWGIRVDRSDASIAKAVEQSHPDRSVDIYLHLAHSIAGQTNVKTYPEVGDYLKRAKPLLARAKTNLTWEEILAEFRAKHGRKPRLMEVIDRVAGKRVTGTIAARRRKRR